MKTLYIECNMGISGDMLMAALWELIDNKDVVLKDIKKIGLPYTEISFDKKTFCGIMGTHANVYCKGMSEHDCKNSHNTLYDVTSIINSLNINDTVKNNSLKAYNYLANAEAKVHNTNIDNIHFHEVGTLDAIADVVVCSYLIDLIKCDKIICSPVNVGSGFVKCAHGLLPVPAPATAELLTNIPYYTSDIETELCTPTGAALVKTFVSDFSAMPTMINTRVGCGFGTKQLERANCVRVFLGECKDSQTIELAANIDDMTPEDLAYACEILLANGALDVYQTPITMKKSRLGIMLSVICEKSMRDTMLRLMFKHTSTIGIREYSLNRATLKRNINKINTPFGSVDKKISFGFDTKKEKLEFDDIKSIADANNLTLEEVKKLIN